jgi:hypothetical protein
MDLWVETVQGVWREKDVNWLVYSSKKVAGVRAQGRGNSVRK